MAGTSVAVADNLQKVRMSIVRAATRAGRSPEAIQLVAVSKTKPPSLVIQALRAGQMAFGENYVQEALEKTSEVPGAEWHFIGHLQTNKVKQAIGRFALIHSVDREKLALELAEAAKIAGTIQDILVQVRVGDEDTKHGIDIAKAPALIDSILQQNTLRLRGVMSLPPLSDDERVARGYFSQVREAFEKWKRARLGESAADSFTELSLGTSADFEWAILEGATIVRVGTAIFGER